MPKKFLPRQICFLVLIVVSVSIIDIAYGAPVQIQEGIRYFPLSDFSNNNQPRQFIEQQSNGELVVTIEPSRELPIQYVGCYFPDVRPADQQIYRNRAGVSGQQQQTGLSWGHYFWYGDFVLPYSTDVSIGQRKHKPTGLQEYIYPDPIVYRLVSNQKSNWMSLWELGMGAHVRSVSFSTAESGEDFVFNINDLRATDLKMVFSYNALPIPSRTISLSYELLNSNFDPIFQSDVIQISGKGGAIEWQISNQFQNAYYISVDILYAHAWDADLHIALLPTLSGTDQSIPTYQLQTNYHQYDIYYSNADFDLSKVVGLPGIWSIPQQDNQWYFDQSLHTTKVAEYGLMNMYMHGGMKEIESNTDLARFFGLKTDTDYKHTTSTSYTGTVWMNRTNVPTADKGISLGYIPQLETLGHTQLSSNQWFISPFGAIHKSGADSLRCAFAHWHPSTDAKIFRYPERVMLVPNGAGSLPSIPIVEGDLTCVRDRNCSTDSGRGRSPNILNGSIPLLENTGIDTRDLNPEVKQSDIEKQIEAVDLEWINEQSFKLDFSRVASNVTCKIYSDLILDDITKAEYKNATESRRITTTEKETLIVNYRNGTEAYDNKEIIVSGKGLSPYSTYKVTCNNVKQVKEGALLVNNLPTADQLIEYNYTNTLQPYKQYHKDIIAMIDTQYNWGGEDFLGFGIIGVLGIISAFAGFSRTHLPSSIVIFIVLIGILSYFELLSLPEAALSAILVIGVLVIFQRGHK